MSITRLVLAEPRKTFAMLCVTIIIPDTPESLTTPTVIQCFQCQSLDPYAPNALSTSAPFAEGPPLDILSTPTPCALAQSAESSVMWAPIVQLQPRLALPLSLSEWVTLEDFELVSQGYKGGNVMVEETPTSSSPFSLVNCMLLSHFSFNDFITIAFLNLARDLDVQI